MESSLLSPRLDRKTIEKNRRLHMKSLYSKLDSLLPGSKHGLSLSYKLEEAVRYTKGLKVKLEKMKEKKAGLVGGEGTSGGASSGLGRGSRLPHIQVQDLNSGLRVVFISSPRDGLVFYEVVRILEEEGAEAVTASVSVVGERAFHTIHFMVRDPQRDLAAGMVVERLKKGLHEFDRAPYLCV